MAFLDLAEALEELGYGDANETVFDVMHEKLAYAGQKRRGAYRLNGPARRKQLARQRGRKQHGRYKLGSLAWRIRNAKRRKNAIAYRFQWRLPFQPHRVCNTSELLDQQVATRLAHQRAEKWA